MSCINKKILQIHFIIRSITKISSWSAVCCWLLNHVKFIKVFFYDSTAASTRNTLNKTCSGSASALYWCNHVGLWFPNSISLFFLIKLSVGPIIWTVLIVTVTTMTHKVSGQCQRYPFHYWEITFKSNNTTPLRRYLKANTGIYTHMKVGYETSLIE